MSDSKSEIRDNMQIEWDVAIAMDDGIVLRADVFRPVGQAKHPVILSYGPYAKGLSFQEGYKGNWARLVEAAPEVLVGSTNKYQNWELVDPERWVPDGYACVRIDSRGAGRSPGMLDVWSPRETLDLYQCVEWAGTQSWSNGKVGINGISYYAMNQWTVGALRPPHLAALCIWEGSSDYYRELCRHGGILSDFFRSWFPRQVVSMQHGIGGRGPKSAVTGELVAGLDTLADSELVANRADSPGEAERRKLYDEYYAARTADFSQITAPLLSAANWGGMGLHTRGNFEGYLAAGSEQKWLEAHGDTHFTHFYSKYGEALQRRFFGYFLKGEDTGWDKQPRVALNIRHPNEKFVLRDENEWPLARTRWTKYFLHPDGLRLTPEPSPKSMTLAYETAGDGLTFRTPPMARSVEITGPVAVKLWLSSQSADADVFLALRLFGPDGKEITFIGSNDPRVPIGLGWLRASHRKLDAKKSLPYRPWHTHDEEWSLQPGQAVELDVEIWPTSIVVPPGYQLALSIRGRDYEVDGKDIALPNAAYPMKGVGPFLHIDPNDRPPGLFATQNTLHFSKDQRPYLLLPIIPERKNSTGMSDTGEE
ncbi:MAG: CocE/NonD family hydrolase [Xanthobacteraceae bacterium]